MNNNMSENKRLVETMAKLLAEVHEFRMDVNGRLSSVDGKVGAIDTRLKSIERQQAVTNLELKEVKLSVMRLADEMGNYRDLDKRVKILEDKVRH